MRPGVSMATRSPLGASTTAALAIAERPTWRRAVRRCSCSARRLPFPSRRCQARCGGDLLVELADQVAQIRHVLGDLRRQPCAHCPARPAAPTSDWRFVSCSAGQARARLAQPRRSRPAASRPRCGCCVMTRTRSLSCSASATACPLSSGKADASSMALRTMDRASSRRVTITGGGFLPMRCMAASSAEIEPWRCLQRSRADAFPALRARPPAIRSGSAGLRSAGSSLPVSISRALMRWRSAAILSRSACSSLERLLRRLQAALVGLQALARFVGAERALRRSEQRTAAAMAAAMQPAGPASSACAATSLPRSLSRCAKCAMIATSESPANPAIRRNSLSKDHANCGMGELAGCIASCCRGVAESVPAMRPARLRSPALRALHKRAISNGHRLSRI